MADYHESDDKNTQARRFINEKIVKPPMSKNDRFKRLLGSLMAAIMFGFIAAVTFVISKPVAEDWFVKETAAEGTPVVIPKDDPDAASFEAVMPTEEPSTELIEDMLKSAMEKYPFSMGDFNTLYGNLRSLVQKADKGIVTVHSVKTQKDWFDNPVEYSGLFAGIIISSVNEELLVLTPEGAIEDADSVRVAFIDGTEVEGRIKQTDHISGMAIVSVSTEGLGKTLLEEVKVFELGNSYSVKQGDPVIAIGAPLGMVHSSGYGFISYVTKNVQAIDSMTRVFYSDVKGNAKTGTFLMNTDGQIIGWVTDEYKNEDNQDMTAVVAISDYKNILEKMSNGDSYPYLGIKGQEVSVAMNESGMPLGVYVVDIRADSPAYNSGIQCGDIITSMGGEDITTMKGFQITLEQSTSQQAIPVIVFRSGREEYKKIQFQVTLEAR